jgi:hypothetical protein
MKQVHLLGYGYDEVIVSMNGRYDEKGGETVI